jgi:hypothetical protein
LQRATGKKTERGRRKSGERGETKNRQVRGGYVREQREKGGPTGGVDEAERAISRAIFEKKQS